VLVLVVKLLNASPEKHDRYGHDEDGDSENEGAHVYAKS
jgi:hypothetical protein